MRRTAGWRWVVDALAATIGAGALAACDSRIAPVEAVEAEIQGGAGIGCACTP